MQTKAKRAQKRVWRAGLCALLVALPGVASASPQIDLIGTWYVLIHYRDEASASPQADRWEDRIWLFEKKGSRLAWTEYPTVLFTDARGRFERTLSGVEQRVLAAWEPNADQRAEIARGLRAESRGSKTKTLRGSASKGYKSVGGLRSQSVSVIGYHETWSIEGLSDNPARPVFSREDLMGSGRTAKMEGRTQYSATEVLEDGALIRGEFERDGSRHGVFRMMRAGELAKPGSRKTVAEAKRPYLTVFGFRDDRPEIASLASQGDSRSEADLLRLRELLRKSIGRSLDDHGLEGAALAQRTESLSSQVEVLLIERGMTPDEIDEMVRQGQIRP